MTLAGALSVLFGDRVDIGAQQVIVGATGSMTMGNASVVDVNAPSGLSNAGTITLNGGSLGVSGGLTNEAAGSLTAFGGIEADVLLGSPRNQGRLP